jgi:alpha-1,2-mannosyltransferase
LALATLCWYVVAVRFFNRAQVNMPLDFQVYRDAALSMLRGEATYRRTFTHVHLRYTYPPFALLMMSALAQLSTPVALGLWSLCSAAALVVFAALAFDSLVKLPRVLNIASALALSGAACLFLQPLRSSLEFGQVNFLLMLAVIVDLLFIRSPRRGILTGIAAAMKLTPLIYIGYFALSRARSSFVRALSTFVAAAGIAWFVLPADSTLFWFHQAFSPGRKGKSMGRINQSWFGFTKQLFPASHALSFTLWLVLSLTTLIVAVLLAKSYLNKPRPVEALLSLALAEVLISPISWAHHWSWIILIPILLVTLRQPDRWVVAAMSLVLLVAYFEPYKWRHLHGVTAHGPLPLALHFALLLSGAILLVTMALTELKRSVPTQSTLDTSMGADGTHDPSLS